MCKQKLYIWNPATCSGEKDKYLGNIIEDSTTMCDEIINAVNFVSTNITGSLSTKFYKKGKV